MNYNNSKKIYKNAINHIPGGVNSPVRAFKSVGTSPVFITGSEGSKLYDEDNNEYIDYIGSWGPMILGHNHKEVIKEVSKAIKKGSSFGLPTADEVKLAEIIKECIPSIDKIRLTTSGTEAAMAAVRLARAYTKKNKIIKFNGCYHGHSDSMLVKAGSGALTYKTLDSNGITEGVVNDTLTVEYNDIKEVEKLFSKNKNKIAAVIIEPVAANMGIVLPENNFLKDLRMITKKHKALLIFDEVITGFRIGLDGAQGLYNITPDLTILGKIIGGGYPIGAFGGRKDIMDMIAPQGAVYHAGTLSGNIVSVTAGLTTLSIIKSDKSFYKKLEEKTVYLTDEIKKIIHENIIKASVNNIASLFTIFFADKKINNLNDAMSIDTKTYTKYFIAMLDNGIMLPPSQFEANFVSHAHSKNDLDKTINSIKKAFGKL